MRRLLFLIGIILMGCHPENQSEDVRRLLIEQIENTHTNKDWFVPLSEAIDGLSQHQAHYKDSLGNHSICELVSHITFWNERMLLGLLSKPPKPYDNDNLATFSRYCFEDWPTTVSKADSVQDALSKALENATEDQIHNWSTSMANMTAHVAYHTGQIVLIRKTNKWWDQSKGVQ